MHDAGERLVSLINNILDLSSIEAGYMELETAPIDVHKMLQDLQDLTREWARKEQIEVKLLSTPATGEVVADERRLKQVLLNLIRNAIAFTPAGGSITLTATRSDSGVMIAVSDTGPGIAKEDQERVFEPFERAQGGTGTRGAGLGLTLVKNIVEMHKGSVALESEEGKGTTVMISLPTGQPHG
jgi:signal transduction histidine kinase